MRRKYYGEKNDVSKKNSESVKCLINKELNRNENKNINKKLDSFFYELF